VLTAVAGFSEDPVVDANAIRLAPGEGSFPNAVFTPDANEVDVITEQYESLAVFAAETGAVVVSTGGTDEIHAGGERWTNETGTPEITVGGAARTPASSPRSSDGAWIALRPPGPVPGSSGAPASGQYSIGMRAMDVIEFIPRVLVDHRESAGD